MSNPLISTFQHRWDVEALLSVLGSPDDAEAAAMMRDDAASLEEVVVAGGGIEGQYVLCWGVRNGEE